MAQAVGEESNIHQHNLHDSLSYVTSKCQNSYLWLALPAFKAFNRQILL